MPVSGIQKRITDWCELCFGAEQMSSPLIRGLRLLEEATEFAQSVDVPVEKCRRLIEYVYARPKGTPAQELGGVGVCLHAAASSISESTEDLTEREISRCEAKPPGHFTARNEVKVDAGFDACQSQGMTKPSYEEPKRYVHLSKEAEELIVKPLESELARVRGLLQRLMETAARYDTFGDNSFAFRTTVNEARQVLQAGAESADIGKLDSADKHLKNLLRRCYQWIPLEASGLADDVKESLGMETYRAIRGSAETGGEKAAPEKCGRFADPPNLDDCTFHIHLKKNTDEHGVVYYVAHILELDIVAVDPEPWRAMEKISLLVNRQIEFGLRNSRGASIWFPAPKKYFDEAGANFPRSPQNQTVSSGVEGAHEGTTADKCSHVASKEECAAHSGEPEKLNNAHQCLNRSSYDANRRCSKVSQHSGECVFPALAESSLSSPLQPEIDWKEQWDAQNEKRMVVNLDENCIETIKRLTATGGEEISFGGNMGGVLLRWTPNFRQSSSLSESVAESAHSGKQNTADKSELLPTQLDQPTMMTRAEAAADCFKEQPPAQERLEAARKAMQLLNPPPNWPEHYAEAMAIIDGRNTEPVDRRHLIAMRAERIDHASARARRELKA